MERNNTHNLTIKATQPLQPQDFANSGLTFSGEGYVNISSKATQPLQLQDFANSDLTFGDEGDANISSSSSKPQLNIRMEADYGGLDDGGLKYLCVNEKKWYYSHQETIHLLITKDTNGTKAIVEIIDNGIERMSNDMGYVNDQSPFSIENTDHYFNNMIITCIANNQKLHEYSLTSHNYTLNNEILESLIQLSNPISDANNYSPLELAKLANTDKGLLRDFIKSNNSENLNNAQISKFIAEQFSYLENACQLNFFEITAIEKDFGNQGDFTLVPQQALENILEFLTKDGTSKDTGIVAEKKCIKSTPEKISESSTVALPSVTSAINPASVPLPIDPEEADFFADVAGDNTPDSDIA